MWTGLKLLQNPFYYSVQTRYLLSNSISGVVRLSILCNSTLLVSIIFLFLHPTCQTSPSNCKGNMTKSQRYSNNIFIQHTFQCHALETQPLELMDGFVMYYTVPVNQVFINFCIWCNSILWQNNRRCAACCPFNSCVLNGVWQIQKCG